MISNFNYKKIAEEKLIAIIPGQMLTTIDVAIAGKYLQRKGGGRKGFYLHGLLFDIAKKKNVNGRRPFPA